MTRQENFCKSLHQPYGYTAGKFGSSKNPFQRVLGRAWGGAPVTALSFGYFSLGLLPAKKSNNKQLALTPPRRLLHRCRRRFSYGVFRTAASPRATLFISANFILLSLFATRRKGTKRLVPFKGMARRPSRWVPTALCEMFIYRLRRGMSKRDAFVCARVLRLYAPLVCACRFVCAQPWGLPPTRRDRRPRRSVYVIRNLGGI